MLAFTRLLVERNANSKEMTMKTIARTLLALMLLSSSAFAVDLVNVAGASHIAISGYDPVAFFTDGKPAYGSPFISAMHRGATYLFASEEHRKMFTSDPDRYVPQYGGFCAYGVAHGGLFPVDISTWQVRNDKLYLNFSPDVAKKFNSDFNANVAKAEKYWPGLVQKNER
jgi:YHS domain-containing protein